MMELYSVDVAAAMYYSWNYDVTASARSSTAGNSFYMQILAATITLVGY